jgi:hypothetical protein
MGLEEVLRHPGLRVDHSDVVDEDVVQFVGDAHALRDHATLGLGHRRSVPGGGGSGPRSCHRLPRGARPADLELAMRAGGWTCEVDTAEGLYGGVDDVLDVIRDRGGDGEVLLVVGHEPTWSAAAATLADGCRFRLPTASVLRLDFDVDGWTNVRGDGRVQWLVTPRLVAKRMRPHG